jgi:hypothetical protein
MVGTIWKVTLTGAPAVTVATTELLVHVGVAVPV